MRNVAIVALLLPAFGAAQTAGAGTVQVGSFTGSASFGAPPRQSVITGHPYTCEDVFEHTQVLADGTRISSRSVSRRYRDSFGRMRVEPAESSGMITILDPVAGFRYMLYRGVAHRGPVAPANAGPSTSTPAFQPEYVSTPHSDPALPARPEIFSESLGAKQIDGIPAVGRRDIQSYPVGSIGNDREVIVTDEVWNSPDLRIVLQNTRRDPRSGDIRTWVQNLSRAEPDPALFRPSSDYELVDDNWPVIIHFSSPPTLPPN
jgi:hypothetical protein